MQPVNLNLVSVNEEVERNAQKAFYEKIESEMSQKKAKKLAFWKRVSLVYNPIIALGCFVIYWTMGLRHANII